MLKKECKVDINSLDVCTRLHKSLIDFFRLPPYSYVETEREREREVREKRRKHTGYGRREVE